MLRAIALSDYFYAKFRLSAIVLDRDKNNLGRKFVRDRRIRNVFL